MTKKNVILILCIFCFETIYTHAQAQKIDKEPLKVIFETDMGDVDDALALDMLYKYCDLEKVDLLAVSTNTDNQNSALFLDLMNTWYGYPSVSIGFVENGVDSEGGSHNFAETVVKYKNKDKSSFKRSQEDKYIESVHLYRQILSKQADSSVVIISVGFSTNLARLINSTPDEFSDLNGKELVNKKVKFLSVMAGNFKNTPTLEYNVVTDINSAAKVFDEWPTKIILSPFEVGNSMLFPAKIIENKFNWVEHHPLIIAYKSYLPMPYDRPTWDLTSVLYAVEEDSGYFSLSKPGIVSINEEGYTSFTKNSNGKHQIIHVNQKQREKILSRFIELVTTKPTIYNNSKKSKQSSFIKNSSFKISDEKNFSNPGIDFRPLRIIHSGLNDTLIDKLSKYGYGGLVSNVSFNNYLRSEENWDDFEQAVKYAIEQKGLRIWLYDEKGWPSGSAGGLVLSKYPKLEAQGLAVLTEIEKEQGTVRVEHPKGHGKVVLARAYNVKGVKINLDHSVDLREFLDDKDNLEWKAPKGEWYIFYFVQKPFYESTHATHNWFEKRRYVNLLEKRVADYFIEITHQQYYQRLGKYFGKGIEAFFTDEPSLLGTYFTGYDPPTNPSVLDSPDPKFKLLPTLNWGNNFLYEFNKRRGYDLYPYLPFLISEESKEARKTRVDYYRTVTELVAENYFEPLEEFCTQTGIASSGHLLLEEKLFYHPIFYGDIMSMYKKMHYPGIDLLTSYPNKAKDWGITVAKFASSAANYYGKKHVMSEISNAFDNDDAGLEGMIASVGVQFAFGIDFFNSYYRHDIMSEEENRQFTDYIGRVGALLNQAKRVPKIAFYYPIESVWENTFPAMNLNPSAFNSKAVSISNNFKQLAKDIADNHIDFDYMDTDQILKCEIEGNKLITPSGGEFELLVIPGATIIPSKLLTQILAMSNSGVKIIFQDSYDYLNLINGKESNTWNNILYNENVKITDSVTESVDWVKNMVQSNVLIEDGNQEVVLLHKRNSTKDLYLFVNTGKEREFSVSFFSSKSKIKFWDPHTGSVYPIKAEKHKNKIVADLALGKWQTAIISIE
jgi:inosine-uridine nucleoside N-ribohydrolase